LVFSHAFIDEDMPSQSTPERLAEADNRNFAHNPSCLARQWMGSSDECRIDRFSAGRMVEKVNYMTENINTFRPNEIELS
jgi:hypothetical protein